MITYHTCQTAADLQGILTLQKANLYQALPEEERQSQGFVTVAHTYQQLANLNNLEKHVVAKAADKVVAYLLVMTAAASEYIPILVPMFKTFDSIYYREKPISDYRYLVVGQVCVDKAFRGLGVFEKCYHLYKQLYQPRYDFVVTEIDATNIRSLRAHERIGFRKIGQYTADTNVEWVLVVWDWHLPELPNVLHN